MPTISQEENEKAKEFLKLINGLMGIIDELTDNMPEGDYLKICTHLKDLHGFKNEIGAIRQVVSNNEVVANQRRRANMRIRVKPRILSDAEKLNSGSHRVCEFCDKVISKSWYDSHIENTEYCFIARRAKKLAITTKEQDNRARVEAIAKIRAVLFKKRYPTLAGLVS